MEFVEGRQIDRALWYGIDIEYFHIKLTKNKNKNMFTQDMNSILDYLEKTHRRSERNNTFSSGKNVGYVYHLSEIKGGYRFQMEVSGCSSEDVSVKYKNNKVSIKAECKLQNFENTYEHELTIGQNIEWKKITATVKNGILTVELPLKSEFDQERTIL